MSLHIVCPHCYAVNRIPAGRINDGPACGQCKKSLFQQHPLEVDGQGFRKMVDRNDIPLLVDFWAPWCGPCQMMGPAFQQAAQQLEPEVRLLKVNTEQEQQIGGQYGIRSIPTMMLFRQGREIARQSGAMGAADIVAWVQSQL